MTLRLDTIRDNFQEIYSAVHHRSPSSPQLVANFQGTKIYDATRGWGVLWNWIYSFLLFFGARHLKEKRLHEALKKTEQLYRQQLSDINRVAKEYKQQVTLLSGNSKKKISQNRYHANRNAITHWNLATKRFLKTLYKENNQKLMEVFKRDFELKDNQDIQHLFPKSEETKKLQKLIDLENTLERSLPLKSFRNLTFPVRMEKRQVRTIKRFLIHMIENSQKLNVRLYHKGLTALTPLIERTSTGEIIYYLHNHAMTLSLRGALIHGETDHKHQRWIHTLQTGTKLTVKGKVITLGKRLGKVDLSRFDKKINFAIEEHPFLAVHVGQNRATSEFIKTFLEKRSWGIKPITIHHIEQEGKFAIVDRYAFDFTQIPWEGKGADITSKDKQFIHVIVALIKFWIDSEHTPERLNAKYAMFTFTGEVRYIKTPKRDRFDYMGLEQFVYDCSRGSYPIYQILMKASGLMDFPYQKFFIHILKEKLIHHSSIPYKIIGGNYQIPDLRIIQRAEQLVNESNALIDLCLKKIYCPTEKIAQAIIQQYEKHNSIGRLWPFKAAFLNSFKY